jgi:hypothetical protein
VTRRTTVLLLRARYHIITIREKAEYPLLAEECLTLGFAGSPENPEWLEKEAIEKLLTVQPDGNITTEQTSDFVGKVLQGMESLQPRLTDVIHNHGKELLEAHQRVREAARIMGIRYRVEPQLPPDVLGVYVYLPKWG